VEITFILILEMAELKDTLNLIFLFILWYAFQIPTFGIQIGVIKLTCEWDDKLCILPSCPVTLHLILFLVFNYRDFIGDKFLKTKNCVTFLSKFNPFISLHPMPIFALFKTNEEKIHSSRDSC
jgi:hypothetical protein